MPTLLLLFFTVPLLEAYLLIEVGQAIGALQTIAAVVATAIIGAFLVRYQGITTVLRLQKQTARGELPARALFDGACLLVAGALLLTPGFATDAVGFALLTPPFRSWAFRRLEGRLMVQMGPFEQGGQRPRDPEDPHTIEGQFRERDDDPWR
jgi:UPF0716 protein FxsA